VLYPVNPATTARYRQAFKTSRAKDDPSDAQICLELLLHHREKLTPWLPEDAQTRELSCLLQHRRTAVDLRTLLSNMLRATRSRVIIPRPLELAGQDLFAPLGCQFLLKWPSLQELQKARKESVRKFYYAHNCRRMDVVPRLIPKIFEIGGDAEIAAAHELKSRIHRCLLVVLFNFAKAHGWLAFTANRRGRARPFKVKERDVAIYTPPEGALVRRGGRGFCSLRRFARLRGRAAGRVAQGSRVGINQLRARHDPGFCWNRENRAQAKDRLGSERFGLACALSREARPDLQSRSAQAHGESVRCVPCEIAAQRAPAQLRQLPPGANEKRRASRARDGQLRRNRDEALRRACRCEGSARVLVDQTDSVD
jgi:hypothetical protein